MKLLQFLTTHPRHRYWAPTLAGMLLPMAASAAPNVEFNPMFLQGGGGQLDLSRFERGDQPPGTYNADIKVNGVLVARHDVVIRALDDGGSAVYLSKDVLDSFGIDMARLPQGEGGLALPDGDIAADELSRYVPEAAVRFDTGELVLEASIPQLYLARDPRGWVSPALWDRGLTAARLGYSISNQWVRSGGEDYRSTSATLGSGLNIGSWRLRHDGYLAQSSDSPLRYSPGRTYAQRALTGLGMELTVGEAGTSGDLFDGVSYRGFSLVTDPRMLPDSQRGYAPVVRGVAQSSAKVIIRQRDYVLYQTNVAPGPFEIDDLYGTAYAGDLEVEVVESDGRVQRFTVPYATVPQLLRVGQQRLSATVGALQDNSLRDAPGFFEATVRRGIGNPFTAYTGVSGTEGYAAALLGGGFNTPVGALAADVTFSRTELPAEVPGFGQKMAGQSYRVSYSKSIDATQTNISMAAYRYSTDGYLTLNEAARLRQDLNDGLAGQDVARQRSRLDLTVNQRLGEGGGSFYVNGSSATYWNQNRRNTSYAVGYSNSWGLASYSISTQRTMERNLFGGAGRDINSVNFSLSVPLGWSSSAPRLTTGLGRSSDGRQDLRAGVTGTFGEQRQGSYSASTSHSRSGSTDSRSNQFNLGYQASVATVSAGYSHSSGSRGLTLGASGGVVMHGDGVLFSQRLGDTIGIVQVPGAAGAHLANNAGVKTNGEGYAVVPYLQPYQRNEVTVDPKGLPLDVELKSSSATAVPTAGAVVKLLVPTSTGRSALIEAPLADGRSLPFGQDVYNEAGEVVGVVGQASRLWVRGIEERGRLTVRWGQDAAQHCAIDYDLATITSAGALTGQCLSPGHTH
ncbi:fimbria/pilus outer membrane usher protein [Oceanisphaera sp. KMM 10153]|uniref:fimbria/pilus outer membrane usher protein n=1 Tax=Oceanisphaera submarina TaxID=3390193 RepID=UPI0039770691